MSCVLQLNFYKDFFAKRCKINGGGQDKYQETGIISYKYPFFEKEKNDISVYKACITANIVKVSVVFFLKKDTEMRNISGLGTGT